MSSDVDLEDLVSQTAGFSGAEVRGQLCVCLSMYHCSLPPRDEAMVRCVAILCGTAVD